MAAFNRLVLKTYPRLASRETSDTKFWKKYSFPITVKEFSAINSISFSPSQPHDFAVTSSNRVQIYSCTTNEIKKTLSKFKDTAYSGCFRGDGKLLVAGSEDGIVKIFDASSRVVLRQYVGHTGAVHSTKFSSDSLHVLSGSDDCTVRMWDIPSEKETLNVKEHKDYVRCTALNNSSKDIWLSGSYDHTVKMWDSRTPASIMTMNHGHPVESVLVFPSGGLCASAGHNVIKVWDIFGGGRLVTAFSNHQKTITSLCFDGQCHRLLSASLDRHVKIYDVQDYKVVHSMDYSSPILCMGIAPDDKHIVVGMSDGLLSIKYRSSSKHTEERSSNLLKDAPKPGTYRYFIRGKNQKPEHGDFVVDINYHGRRLNTYDKLLQKFEYTKALDSVLKPNTRKPGIVVSLILELIRRDGLRIALSGRDEEALAPVLTFLIKYLCHPCFSSTLIDVTNIILDIYAPVLGQSPVIDDLFAKLKHKIKLELCLQKQAFELMGCLDTIFAASS